MTIANANVASKSRRPVLTEEEIQIAIKKVVEKLYEKFNKHGFHACSSIHESLGFVTEEYDELVEAVRSGMQFRVKDELEDIAVAALFGIATAEGKKFDW